jgi:superfamily II DNA or RNA helicase
MTLSALRPRPYQREALDALAAKFREGLHRVALVLPTGGGKTVVFAHEVLEYLAEHPDRQVVILVHTDELVQQAFDKLVKVAPHLNVGIIKARRRDVDAPAIVASVRSLQSSAARAQVKRVGKIIVDECHHVTTKTYMDILTDWGGFGGGTIVSGYTATLMRSDGKSLGAVWQSVAFRRDVGWMVRKRFLVPPRGLAVQVPDLNLREVKANRTDYRKEELGEALAESLAPSLVAAAILEHAAGRKTLGFAPTVASAYVFAEACEDAGIPARVVHGGMATDDRKATLSWHSRGTVLWNCMILTEGYDDPEVDCIVVARPTKSKPLYQQIVGRGLRVDLERDYEGQDCLILDVVGANAEHDLASLVDLSERPIKPEDAHSGKTLVQLEDELDGGGGIVDADQPEYWTGDVVSREFDPMGRPSPKVWLKTRGGTFFMPAGKTGYVFLVEWPEPHAWSVAWCSKNNSTAYSVDPDGVPRPAWPGKVLGMTEHRGLSLEEAMVWAGDLAQDMGTDLDASNRKAAWRKKKPSEGMLGLARSLGIKIVEGAPTAGKLSDQITVKIGSGRIDPIVAKVRR